MYLCVQWKLNLENENKFSIENISKSDDNIKYNYTKEKNCLIERELVDNLDLDIIYNSKIDLGNGQCKSRILYLIIEKINPITMCKIIKILFCSSIPKFNKLLKNEIINIFNFNPIQIELNYCKLKTINYFEQKDNFNNNVIIKLFEYNLDF